MNTFRDLPKSVLCLIILSVCIKYVLSSEDDVKERLDRDDANLSEKKKEKESPAKIVVQPGDEGLNHTTIHWTVGEPKRKLQCIATGVPMPKIQWSRRGGQEKLNPSREDKAIGLSELEFAKVDYGTEGYYTCSAKNEEGADERVFHVIVDKEGVSVIAIVFGTLAGIAIIVLSAFLVYLKLKNKKYKEENKYIPQEEIEAFRKGNKDLVKSSENYLGNSHELIQAQPYDTEYEIPRNKIFVYEHLVLGSGEYGIVVQGAVHNPQYGNLLKVAIKTLKTESDVMYYKALLSELKIFIFIGKHPNIVNLIGACTENLRQRELYVAVEFCQHGNLKDFLMRNRGGFIDPEELNEGMTHEINVPDKKMLQKSISEDSRDSGLIDFKNLQCIARRDLIKWSYEIAKGMEFLASKNVIHADLAARNVLLTKNLIAKISDFGLSKQLMNYTNYVKKQQCPLPWRWMAIESLKDYSFSVKSDVWSYGVCVWEIFSLGEVPYPGQVWNPQFLQDLTQGLRMSAPSKATPYIYDSVMLPCWNAIPMERPDFFKLKQDFEQLLTSISDEEYMDVLNGSYAELMDQSNNFLYSKSAASAACLPQVTPAVT